MKLSSLESRIQEENINRMNFTYIKISAYILTFILCVSGISFKALSTSADEISTVSAVAGNETSIDEHVEELERKRLKILRMQIKLHLRQEDYSSAKVCLQKIVDSYLDIKEKPEKEILDTGRDLAFKLFEAEQHGDCLQLTEKLLRITPDDSVLFRINRLACSAVGDDKAAKEWEQKARTNIQDERYHYRVAQFFIKRNKRDPAQEEYNIILEMDPAESVYDANAIFFQADCANIAGYYIKAADLFIEAFALSEKIGSFILFGNDKVKTENVFLALAREMELRNTSDRELQLLLNVRKHLKEPSPYLLTGIADALYRLEQYEESIENYQKSIELNPELSYTYSGYGDALMKLGRKKEAKQAFAKTVELFKKGIEESETDYAKARNYNGLAWFYAIHDKRLKDAEKLSRKSLELAPGRPEYLDTLAEICYRRHKKDEAIKLIQKAIDTKPRHLLYYEQQLRKFRGETKPIHKKEESSS